MTCPRLMFFFFFFNDTATTEIYTLSLHDALPISGGVVTAAGWLPLAVALAPNGATTWNDCPLDRKSTRLNSSHQIISYAVFCLKKKKKNGVQQDCNHTSDTTSTLLHTCADQ